MPTWMSAIPSRAARLEACVRLGLARCYSVAGITSALSRALVATALAIILLNDGRPHGRSCLTNHRSVATFSERTRAERKRLAGRRLCAGGLNQAEGGVERRSIGAGCRGWAALQSAPGTNNPFWIRALCAFVALLAWLLAIREALLLVRRRRQLPR
jgi:hypothetical protein